MKRLMCVLVALIAICGSVFAASADFSMDSKVWENVSQDLKITNICDLMDNDLNEIMLGNHPEIIVEFSAQTTLPISFFLKGDLVNLVENDVNFGAVEIAQTFYARCMQQKLFLSTNLIDWKPFLEFLTGSASVSLNIQNGKPSIVVGAETNKRS